jgi:hypothetical protein
VHSDLPSKELTFSTRVGEQRGPCAAFLRCAAHFSALSSAPRITSKKPSTISFASCLSRPARSHSIAISSAFLSVGVRVGASAL